MTEVQEAPTQTRWAGSCRESAELEDGRDKIRTLEIVIHRPGEAREDSEKE